MDETTAQMTLEREVTDGGRTYQITASILADGRTEISVRSGSVDALELNELSGIIAKEDLPVIARILKPELASIAAWQGVPLDERAYTMAERRRDHPNAGTSWTEEQEAQLLELYQAGVSIREIANRLGRRPGGVSARLDKLALQSSLNKMSQTVS
ncbi:MAG TPA: hypothetical protein DGG94_22640 [Micromonosporaceae bacterium]|nr:hypothetical protein [Micromonosporaceae bacterium]HCU52556.1 hypothetical protein [Micromonosporaceae bacterium]